MNYITTKEVMAIEEIIQVMIVYDCSHDRIKGAKKMQNKLFVLVDAEKSAGGRYRSIKVKGDENK